MDFTKKSYADAFFQEVIQKLHQAKIKAIFSLSPVFWFTYDGFREYRTDTELYLLFETDLCLVIDYRSIDGLNFCFRKLTDPEKEAYAKAYPADFFHCTETDDDPEPGEPCLTVRYELEYDSIADISLSPVTKPYAKWVDGDIVDVYPTSETFREITFTLHNSNRFVICPDSAEADGYARIWSEDVKEYTWEL